MVINAAMFQSISLVVGILSLHLIHKEAPERVPKFIRILAFTYPAKAFGMGNLVPKEVNKDANINKIHAAEDETTVKANEPPVHIDVAVESLLKELRIITRKIEEKEEESLISSEWKLLAKLVDRVLFCICLFSFILLIIVNLT